MKLKSTICSIFFVSLLSGAKLFAQQEVSYYFAAHEDDWQLFMGTAAAVDVSYAKVIFITLTAGDAGDGDGYGGVGIIPYFQGRENGAIKSVQFLANIPSDGATVIKSTATVNGHKIKKYVYKSTVMYFLRLPDGGYPGNGDGYPGPDSNQSLQKLRTGQITHINAVDRSTTYTSWSDLTKTLKAIINKERGTDPQVYINIPDTNQIQNAGDHSDHYNTGKAATDAVTSLPWVGIASWLDYTTKDSAQNLSTSQIEIESALHACDIIGMTEGHYNSNWTSDHLVWLDKDYGYVTRFPVGSAPLTPDIDEEETNVQAVTSAPAFVLNVHPNPINKGAGLLNAEVETGAPGNVKFYVQDAAGNIISTFEKNISGKEEVNIPINANMNAGVYYITVMTEDNKKETRKIIIQ